MARAEGGSTTIKRDGHETKKTGNNLTLGEGRQSKHSNEAADPQKN